VQETRRWDDDKGESYGMRSKENAHDYRYFPEPDLMPMSIDDAWLENVKANLPELAWQKRERYIRDLGISEYAASVLTAHRNISNLFEIVARQSGQSLEAANLITGEIMRLMNNSNILPEDLSIDAGKLAALIAFVTGGKINRNAYKETIEEVFKNDVDPEKYITEKGLIMVNDDNAVITAVNTVLAENPDVVASWRGGKIQVFGFLMGQVMKKLGGTGNPDVAKKTLTAMLEK
jgi:aspartyl-tRNA(Asn)/glutamyl-tRNA(Gln) amidotransferase subunit B